jgi:hypothetical protein
MANKSKGKALVTGASTGIGAIYADRLAKRGYDLLLVARNEKQLEDLAARLKSETGRNVEVVAADLAKEADLKRVEAKLGTDPEIALLINNAGIAANAKLAEHDLQAIDAMIRLNIVAVTHLASVAAKAFSARRQGTIVNIASVLAVVPEISNATYAGTKAYVLALTQKMKVELADTGVSVQAVLPGATRTELWERSGSDINAFPAEMIMDAGEMVDAALTGLDQGELVTIPSLADAADWKRFEDARKALGPNLSKRHAAKRYAQHRTAA